VWRRFGSQIADVLSKLESPRKRRPGEMRALAHLGLYQAAHNLTRRTRDLPDFQVEQVPVTPLKGDCHDETPYMPIWPVEDQFEKCIDSLRWLRDCVAEAEAIAIEEKSPSCGNRPDSARSLLYESMVAIYWESATSPKKPWWNAVTERYKNVEAIRFHEAVLHPLSVKATMLWRTQQSRLLQMPAVRIFEWAPAIKRGCPQCLRTPYASPTLSTKPVRP
jgi:hypothetical protein